MPALRLPVLPDFSSTSPRLSIVPTVDSWCSKSSRGRCRRFSISPSFAAAVSSSPMSSRKRVSRVSSMCLSLSWGCAGSSRTPQMSEIDCQCRPRMERSCSNVRRGERDPQVLDHLSQLQVRRPVTGPLGHLPAAGGEVLEAHLEPLAVHLGPQHLLPAIHRCFWNALSPSPATLGLMPRCTASGTP